ITFLGILVFLISFSCTKTETKHIIKEIPAGNANIPPESNISVDYPGQVGEDVPRVENYKVALNLNYNNVSQSLRIAQPPQPQFSTGLYAAPDDTIKIRVPEGVEGLSVQIGAWIDTASSGLPNTVIFSRMELKEGNNLILSQYGGPIYILASNPIKDTVTFSFTGAVKSPDFVMG